MKSILFHVQPLFGSGHLNRISRIADYLAHKGYKAVLINGGTRKSGVSSTSVDTVFLPGIRSDATFREYFDEAGDPVTPSLFDKRASLIRQAVRQFRPAMIITEGYPFARRRFAQEIMTLIREARLICKPPLSVVCSVRDVIQPKSKPDREQEIIEIIRDDYDRILIHGDRDFLPFETTFSRFPEIREKSTYTGYLDDQHAAEQSDNVKKSNTIVVSAGGGIAGRQLYLTAIATARTIPGMNYCWHILVGNAIADQDFQDWKSSITSNVLIERNREDFRTILSASMVSVSQCGYNTAVDLISTRTMGLVVPYEEGGEVEQVIRAAALEEAGYVRIISESRLNPDSLIRAIQECEQVSFVPAVPVRLSGNERVFEFVRDTIGPAG